MAYSDPKYDVILSQPLGEMLAATGYSVPATASMYACGGRTSQFRSRDRCVVLGVTVVGGSGGSVGGTVSLKIARLIAGGSESLMTAKSITASKTSSFLGNVEDLACSLNPITLESFGDSVYLTAESTTLADKCANLTNIVWRYRLLPKTTADVSHDSQQQ
jgi:hypothetical protein